MRERRGVSETELLAYVNYLGALNRQKIAKGNTYKMCQIYIKLIHVFQELKVTQSSYENTNNLDHLEK